MKKLFLFLFVIYTSVLLSQTVLTSYPIDVKKSKENNPQVLRTLDDILAFSTSAFNNSKKNNQILNVENKKTHEVFAFIKDNEKITILKYNSALFLSSESSFPIKNLEIYSIEGYSFSEDGNPTLYLSSDGLRNILMVKYYLENKTYRTSNLRFPFSGQHIITQFQKNNSFYILSIGRNDQTLIVNTLNNGGVEKKSFNFSSYKFQDENTQSLTFTQLVIKNPIEKIETDDYNPLYKSTKKSKIYILDNRLILTLDHNSKKTQVFDLNLETNDLNEKNFTQSIIQEPKKLSNSFLQEDKLYQINASESELLLDIKNYYSGQTIKSIAMSKNDENQFKSSPFFIQKDNRKPKDFKETKRFLQHLSLLDVGLSVFKNKKNTFITLGGTPKIERPKKSNSDNTSFEEEEGLNFPEIHHSESVYFERTLDRNFDFINKEQQPLGIDKLYYFLSSNKKITLQNILKFKDYYILGYYNEKSKQYIMRKFTDGFN